MSDLQYTLYAPGDATHLRAAIKQLGSDAYGVHATAIGTEQTSQMQSFLLADETWDEILPKAWSALCFHQHTLVGMAFLMPSGHAWRFFDARHAYLRVVGIHPQWQGKGIGKTLTTLCIQRARELNEHWLTLHTGNFMQTARHIYHQAGFRILHKLPPSWGQQPYWLYGICLKPEVEIKSRLSIEESVQVHRLWNNNYPVQLTDRFPLLLQETSRHQHYLVKNPDNTIAGWAVDFSSAGETRFSLIVDKAHQHQGIGLTLLHQLKTCQPQFSGWVIDHANDVLADGSPYISPLAFYQRYGLQVWPNQRLDTPMISAVKVSWQQPV